MKAFKVNSQRANEIDCIIDLKPQDIDRVLDALDHSPPTIDFEKTQEIVAQVVENDLARALALHAGSLATLADRSDVGMDEILDALRTGLENWGWETAKLEKFDQFRGQFKRLVDHRSFYPGSKASRLFLTGNSHLHSVSSIVDARPLFNADRTEIELSVLFTTLSLEISDANENESQITIAVSEEDLVSIRDECEKALAKLKVLKEKLEVGALGAVVIHGTAS